MVDKVKAGVDLVTGLETNNKGQKAVKEIADKIATKATKMQQKVKRGQAPKDIKRFDSSEKSVAKSKDHVHFKDGTSMNIDGTVHDKKAGTPSLSNKTKEFLGKENWPTKVKDD